MLSCFHLRHLSKQKKNHLVPYLERLNMGYVCCNGYILMIMLSVPIVKFVYCLILNYIQVGSRITSKRISQMLEKCSPCSYIMVDSHPCRHDASHIVTHRIESTVVEFASCLLKARFPNKNSKWSSFLQILNMMVIDPRQ